MPKLKKSDITPDKMIEGDQEVTETKVCHDCGRELPVTEFNYWNKANRTYMNICKECEKKKNAKKHEEKKEIINTLKSCGCCCCDENDINCLDFHHIDPEEKDFNMSAAPNKTTKKIIEEASKCIVVCSNCHRKIHAGVLDINDYINTKQYQYMRSIVRLALDYTEKQQPPSQK